MATTTLEKRRVAGWRLIAVLIMLGFTFQSYVAQTHVHDNIPIGKNLATGQTPNKSPLGNILLDCPFCQTVAHAGTFFMPAASLLILSQVWQESAATYSAVGSNSGATAHSWRIRAPPRP
jgi:hypothetical protein